MNMKNSKTEKVVRWILFILIWLPLSYVALIAMPFAARKELEVFPDFSISPVHRFTFLTMSILCFLAVYFLPLATRRLFGHWLGKNAFFEIALGATLSLLSALLLFIIIQSGLPIALDMHRWWLILPFCALCFTGIWLRNPLRKMF